jgi:hypothetical protein
MRRWVIAGLAAARETTDDEPQCPVCTTAGFPTAPAPHVHQMPARAEETTARVFVFDTYQTED